MSIHRASMLLDLRRYPEALEVLGSLGDEGGSATAHCLRARAYLGLKKLKEAQRAAAAARAADPTHEWGYRLGAIVAREQMRPKEAARLAAEAVRLAPYEPNTHQVATLTAIDAGDKVAALRHAKEMLRLAPHDAMANYTHGLALAADDRAREAEAAFRKALAIDPSHDPSMSRLADLVGHHDAAAATRLRLAAARIAPQEAHNRRQLLKSGGGVVGGGLLAAGKFGLLGKLVAIGWVNSMLTRGFSNDIVGGAVLLTAYAVIFAITRVLRHRHGKTLPPRVWEGLKPNRRNADLLWLAVPACFMAFGALLALLAESAGGRFPLRPLVYVAVSAAVLVACWHLRRGDARHLRLRDLLRRVVDVMRFLWQRRAARRMIRKQGVVPTASGDVDR